jgi:hypothetical protein
LTECVLSAQVAHDITAFEQGKQTFRTGINALGFAVAEVTLEGLLCIEIVVYAAVRAGEGAEATTNTLHLIDPDNTVVFAFGYRPCGAYCKTSRVAALIAAHGSMEADLR